jgi:hypothetical protein
MSNYLASDTDLTSVANAIRTKGGTSAQLAFPAGFVQAIADIPTGGGGATVDDLVAGTWPSGDITIAVSAERHAPFYGVSGIRKVTMTVSGIVSFGVNFFRESGITEFVGLALTELKASSFFYGCASLAKITIPKVTYFESGMCYNCGNLLVADIGGGVINRGNIFTGCKKLQTIIIRGSSVCSLGNVSNLSQTPFYPNSGTGITGTGTLYVPSSLVASYKTASNWSTLFNAGTMAVQSIEGSIYENAYADGTPIT